MSPQRAFAGLRFAPALPAWLLAALALLCLAALGMALWRRAPGAAWRGLAFAVLLGWLAGPRLVTRQQTPLPDVALLVIDQSASMDVAGRTAMADAARRSLQAQGVALPGLELRTVTVPEAGQNGTRLFAAVDRAVAGIPQAQLAGIVLVTDGTVHDVPAKDRYGVPLHVLLAGRGEERDRRLRLIDAPGYGVVGRSVTLKVAVDDLGGPPSAEPAPLTIRRDGELPQVVPVTPGVPQDIALPITREGPSVVELSAAPLPGEVSTLNNRAVVQVNGVRDRLRVLLISGQPHAGERTWRRLLKADPSVDLVHFTILRPPEKDDLTPLNQLALIAFPVRELFQQKIGEFDLIILDRFQNHGILPPQYLQNIADYVRAGGALLLSVGPEFAGRESLDDTPLRDLLPAHPVALDGDAGTPGGAVVDGEFKPQVTALGARHPVTADLPGWHPDRTPDWGDWYRRIATGPAGGDVLMAGPDGAPLLVVGRVDAGRVALLLSDQIWLWSRGHGGGGPQAELLRRVAHWAMKQPALEENALEARISPLGGPQSGRLSILRRSTDPATPPPVTVTSPDGQARRVALTPGATGVAGATLAAAMPGVWQVSDGERTAYAAAGTANPLEMADLRATATRLQPLVASSVGSVHWLAGPGMPADAPELRRTSSGRSVSGQRWIGLLERDAHLVTSVAAAPLLPDWLAVLLLLGLVVLAWWREAA